jgi:YidC/Oxa1 family membrane protein insertase
MDNKRLVIGMVLAMAVVMGWQVFVSYMYKKNPQWKQHDQQTAQTTPPANGTAPSTNTGVEAVAPTTGASITTQSSAAPGASLTNATAQPTRVELGGGDPKGETFPLKLDLSSTGAGIELATLKKYKDHEAKNVYTFQSPPALDPLARPMATRFVTVNGSTFDLAGLNWNVEPGATDRSATFAIDLSLGGVPTARVRKTYEITDAKHDGEGYEVAVKQSFENLTDQPIKVSTTLVGTALPPVELERGPDRQVIAGYPKTAREIEAIQHLAEEFKDNTTRSYTTEKNGLPVLWTGTATVYFNAILRPISRDPASVASKDIAKVEAHALNPDARPADRQIVTEFATTELTVAPKSQLTLPMELYLGPKLRKTLNKEHYAAMPRGLQRDAGHHQWHVRDLHVPAGHQRARRDAWLLPHDLPRLGPGDHRAGRDRAHAPPSDHEALAGLHDEDGQDGPEIERLKKKYGDDKDELNKAMMQVYKQQGFTPVLGCLPMFLQMPIWIALYAALNSTFELRQEPFLWGWTWIKDLARPDHLITWAPIKLFWGIEIGALNILPILLAVVFFLQQKYTPKPPATTPEQQQQQKMMQWMSLLFPVFLYNGPSGLNLYILTSTTIGIIESKRIRDHIKEREEAEKEGKVIVDAKPTRQSKRRGDEPGSGGVGAKKTPPAPKSGFGGWLAGLQEKADQIRREAEKKRG